MMASKQELFEEILNRMNEKGNFDAAILSMRDGLPLASSPTHYEDDMAAVMVTLLNDAAQKINQELNLSQMDEISIVGDDRTRLVCRYFSVDGSDLLLTVMTPPDRAYRRLTNETIKDIKRIWLSL
jgi:predicted regulator of Ras-like GTPase activity (Roadblock/LC7/MglB family)